MAAWAAMHEQKRQLSKGVILPTYLGCCAACWLQKSARPSAADDVWLSIKVMGADITGVCGCVSLCVCVCQHFGSICSSFWGIGGNAGCTCVWMCVRLCQRFRGICSSFRGCKW